MSKRYKNWQLQFVTYTSDGPEETDSVQTFMVYKNCTINL